MRTITKVMGTCAPPHFVAVVQTEHWQNNLLEQKRNLSVVRKSNVCNNTMKDEFSTDLRNVCQNPWRRKHEKKHHWDNFRKNIVLFFCRVNKVEFNSAGNVSTAAF